MLLLAVAITFAIDAERAASYQDDRRRPRVSTRLRVRSRMGWLVQHHWCNSGHLPLQSTEIHSLELHTN